MAALATEALAGVFSAAQTGRLTRNQHILFRLGELAAVVEGAGALCRRAAAAADGSISSKADRRFSAEMLATICRVYAREAALKVADDGFESPVAKFLDEAAWFDDDEEAAATLLLPFMLLSGLFEDEPDMAELAGEDS